MKQLVLVWSLVCFFFFTAYQVVPGVNKETKISIRETIDFAKVILGLEEKIEIVEKQEEGVLYSFAKVPQKNLIIYRIRFASLRVDNTNVREYVLNEKNELVRVAKYLDGSSYYDLKARGVYVKPEKVPTKNSKTSFKPLYEAGSAFPIKQASPEEWQQFEQQLNSIRNRFPDAEIAGIN